MAKKKATKSTKQPSFEDALSELTGIVEQLDGGELPLDESLSQFERGMTLMKHCHTTLSDAEKRVQQLTGFDADGNPQLDDFDDVATADRASGELFD